MIGVDGVMVTVAGVSLWWLRAGSGASGGVVDRNRRTGCRLWSTFGCETAGWDVAAGVVECRCNHTSNFAILMQVVPFEVRRPGEAVDTLLHTSTLHTTHTHYLL